MTSIQHVIEQKVINTITFKLKSLATDWTNAVAGLGIVTSVEHRRSLSHTVLFRVDDQEMVPKCLAPLQDFSTRTKWTENIPKKEVPWLIEFMTPIHMDPKQVQWKSIDLASFNWTSELTISTMHSTNMFHQFVHSIETLYPCSGASNAGAAKIFAAFVFEHVAHEIGPALEGGFAESAIIMLTTDCSC